MNPCPEGLVRFWVEPGHPFVVACAIMEVFHTFGDACVLDDNGVEAALRSPLVPGRPECIKAGLAVLHHYAKYEEPFMAFDYSQDLWGQLSSENWEGLPPRASTWSGRKLANKAFDEYFMPLVGFWNWDMSESLPDISEGDTIEIMRALLPSEGAIADFVRDFYPEGLTPVLADYVAQACPHLTWTPQQFVDHFERLLGLVSDTIIMPSPDPNPKPPYDKVGLRKGAVSISFARACETVQSTRHEAFLEILWSPNKEIKGITYREGFFLWEAGAWALDFEQNAQVARMGKNLRRECPKFMVVWSQRLENQFLDELRRLDESVGYLLSRDLLGCASLGLKPLAQYLGSGMLR